MVGGDICHPLFWPSGRDLKCVSTGWFGAMMGTHHVGGGWWRKYCSFSWFSFYMILIMKWAAYKLNKQTNGKYGGTDQKP